MELFWFMYLFVFIFHQSSSQTIEECIERVNDNVINNPNFVLCPQADQNVLKSCKYQGDQYSGEEDESKSIYNNLQYDSNQSAFNNYSDFIESTSPSSYGIVEHITQIIEWLSDSSMRDLISFDTHFGYAVLKATTNSEHKSADINDQSINDANNLSFLRKQISFEDKQFIEYLQSFMTGINEEQLWSDSINFANKRFQLINVEQLLETYESFGAGIGFEIQIFCQKDTTDPFLLWDGGAGGGGGYNKHDNPAFQYGGGGGIQLIQDSVSIGGGTGYEYPDDWKQYPDADIDAVDSSKLEEIMKDKNQCDQIIVQSGGGSGSGFNRHDKHSNLLGFTYYSLHFVLGELQNVEEIAEVADIANDHIEGNIEAVEGKYQKIKPKGNYFSATVTASFIACLFSMMVVTVLRILCLDTTTNQMDQIENQSDEELGRNVLPIVVVSSDELCLSRNK